MMRVVPGVVVLIFLMYPSEPIPAQGRCPFMNPRVQFQPNFSMQQQRFMQQNMMMQQYQQRMMQQRTMARPAMPPRNQTMMAQRVNVQRPMPIVRPPVVQRNVMARSVVRVPSNMGFRPASIRPPAVRPNLRPVVRTPAPSQRPPIVSAATFRRNVVQPRPQLPPRTNNVAMQQANLRRSMSTQQGVRHRPSVQLRMTVSAPRCGSCHNCSHARPAAMRPTLPPRFPMMQPGPIARPMLIPNPQRMPRVILPQPMLPRIAQQPARVPLKPVVRQPAMPRLLQAPELKPILRAEAKPVPPNIITTMRSATTTPNKVAKSPGSSLKSVVRESEPSETPIRLPSLLRPVVRGEVQRPIELIAPEQVTRMPNLPALPGSTPQNRTLLLTLLDESELNWDAPEQQLTAEAIRVVQQAPTLVPLP